jgi:starch-binding outer membrane protein, SusD/RagB family
MTIQQYNGLMMMRSNRMRLATLTATALAIVTAGCGDITSLKQENPGQLSASTLYVPANAQLLVNGVIADFECAFSRYVVGSGLFADELITAIAGTGNYDYERRTLPPNAAYGTGGCAGTNQNPSIYSTLSTARGAADTVLARLEEWTDAQVPNRTKLLAQAATYAGFSLTLLAEGMCSAAINVGPEMTPAELFAEARLRFDKAIPAATTANDPATLNLALVGRARVLLALNQLPAAAADAARVPASFVANMSTDAVNVRRQNVVHAHTAINFFSSVDPSFRDVTIAGAPDPRVLVTNTTRAGTAPGTVVWTANKYPSLTAPIAIAKYAEAQLIVAEALTAAGDLTGAAAAINAARNTRPGLPAFDPTGLTPAQVKTQIIEERRRELFLEGHRLGDIRRYGLTFSPAPGAPYPPGGGTYGTQTCFPLPDVERINNPNIGSGS